MTLKPLLSLCLSCILAAAPIAGTYAQNYNLPNLGAAGGSALSPMQEHQLGEEIMVEVRSDPTYLNDPETIDYLMRLGYKLVSAGPGSGTYFFGPNRPSLYAEMYSIQKSSRPSIASVA